MRALIVVDVQRDFCEGGALAVEGGNAVAEKIADYLLNHQDEYDRIVFTKDWHNDWPDRNGGHFSDKPDYVDSWPVHCVENSTGALFHESLPLIHEGRVFYKGQGKPDYSGFQGRNASGLLLGEYLLKRGVDEVDIVGIAGDYCVRHTALDALDLGLKVTVLPDMVASVGGPEATQRLLDELPS